MNILSLPHNKLQGVFFSILYCCVTALIFDVFYQTRNPDIQQLLQNSQSYLFRMDYAVVYSGLNVFQEYLALSKLFYIIYEWLATAFGSYILALKLISIFSTFAVSISIFLKSISFRSTTIFICLLNPFVFDLLCAQLRCALAVSIFILAVNLRYLWFRIFFSYLLAQFI